MMKDQEEELTPLCMLPPCCWTGLSSPEANFFMADMAAALPKSQYENIQQGGGGASNRLTRPWNWRSFPGAGSARTPSGTAA